jgi:serine/threonine-protein kinase
MTFATAEDLIDALRAHQLLEPSQLDEVTHDLLPRHSEPRALADVLVERGWLTKFQAEQVLEGKGGDLIVGTYRVLEPIGMGGMGQVYKALQQRLNRVVALKVIRQDRLSRDPEAVRRFHREARAAAQLSHPNVVIVYDADEDKNRHYIAMEYVEGTDLARLVKEHGPLPVPTACDFIRQAALGLQHAFECGMVHRDIKPSNLLVTAPKGRGISGLHPRPPLSELLARRAAKAPVEKAEPAAKSPPWLAPGAVVKIMDMGLARVVEPTAGSASSASSLTQLGTVVGTPDFIAPEQARDARAADIRSDLYSLGCTLYYLLSGQPPFPEGSVMEKLLMHQLDHPQPLEELRPEIPSEVLSIVRRLMEKRPDDRYQTPLELADALAALPPPGAVAPVLPRQLVSAGKPRPGSTAIVQVRPLAQETAVPPAEPTAVPGRDSSEQSIAAGTDVAMRIAKLGGHRGWVTAVTFTTDRNTLASGGVEGTVRLWSFTKDRGEQVLTQPHLREVHSLAFGPDGRTLAAGSGALDGLIWLWDLSAEKARDRGNLQGHKAPVDALAFAPDGRMLASGGYDRTVRIWEVQGGQARERATLKGHTDSVRALAYAPDGKVVASGGQDATVRLWDVGRTWCRERATLSGHVGPVHGVAWAPDGKLLASGGLDQTVRVWNVNGSSSRELMVLKGHPGAVQSVLFPPDGKTIISVSDGVRVILWDLASGNKLREWALPKTMMCSVAFTFDGRYLATGNSDGTAFVYRLYPKRNESSII